MNNQEKGSSPDTYEHSLARSPQETHTTSPRCRAVHTAFTACADHGYILRPKQGTQVSAPTTAAGLKGCWAYPPCGHTTK